MPNRLEHRAVIRTLIYGTAVAAAMTFTAPSAGAQPGVGGAGADVIGDVGGGQSVVVQGSFTTAPSPPAGVGPSSGAGTSIPGGQSASLGSGGGGGGAPAPSGPQPTVFPQSDGTLGVATQGQLDACAGLGLANCVQLPDTGIPGTPPAVVDVANLVNAAVTALQVEPIDIGIVPEPADSPGGRTGLVGMNSWIWVANPREATVGPINRTVTTGGITINMNAVNTGLVVNYGDGLPTLPPLCPVTSVPYTDAAMALPSPTCNHFLQKASTLEPGGTFKVSVTSMWVVTWTAVLPGQVVGGTIPTTATATTEVRVGELQVLVTG